MTTTESVAESKKEETRMQSAGSSEMSRLLKRTFRLAWKVAIVVAIGAFVLYRTRYAPVPVQSRIVINGPVVAEVMGTGTLEPRVQATIGPRISGLVSQVLADQADRVSKGQLLATLYDGDLKQQVEIAKADLAAFRAGVDRAAPEITRAQANVKKAHASYARISTMYEAKAGSADANITDIGLRHIGGLTRLKELDVQRNPITDAGLQHLRALTGLTHLGLFHTRVTDEGVNELRKALPNCKIYRNIGR